MSTTLKWGLGLAILLGLLDVAGVSGVWADDGPPAAIAITGGALGVVTIVAAALARRRGAIPTVVVSRVLSGLLGLPVYWSDDAPDWSKIVVGIALAVTVAAIALLTAGHRASTGQSPARRA